MSTSTPPFLSALEKLFDNGLRLVFWNDAGAEFTADVDNLTLPGVKVLRLDQTPTLQAKVLLEAEPLSRWLVYAPAAVPEPAGSEAPARSRRR